MEKHFFLASREAAGQITNLFDFVWPTAAALWNLRWQVDGFLRAFPTATTHQLNDRFVAGSGLHGTNLKGSCVDTPWDDQTARFASFILVNAFAIYETWADQIVKTMGQTFGGKRLQFPDATARNGLGLEATIASLIGQRSATLEAAYYPKFSASPKHCPALLPNMMLAYRYFKEIRNCAMHSNSGASAAAERAYLDFLPHSDKAALGMRGDLEFEAVVAGQPIRLHLRGVVGFCDILLRIITTVDAELCRSIHAEPAFKQMMKGVRNHPSMLSGQPKRRRQQVRNRCWSAGLPGPADADAVYAFLRAESIIQV